MKNATKKPDKVPEGARIFSISGTQVRDDYLAKGKLLPEWFTRKETAEILQQMYPPRHKQGFCIWFTGLSGSGKSTTAEILTSLAAGARPPGHRAGRRCCAHPPFQGSGLFTRKTAIPTSCASVLSPAKLPATAARSSARRSAPTAPPAMKPARWLARNFVEVFVDTPIEVCEQRDVKGLYARARRGQITGFTGVDDPYEAPVNPEITLDTVSATPEENARKIADFLVSRGYLVRPLTVTNGSAVGMAGIQQLFDLTGRVALVTGGAGLLGAEFCRTLAEAGARVVVADLNRSAAQARLIAWRNKGSRRWLLRWM